MTEFKVLLQQLSGGTEENLKTYQSEQSVSQPTLPNASWKHYHLSRLVQKYTMDYTPLYSGKRKSWFLVLHKMLLHKVCQFALLCQHRQECADKLVIIVCSSTIINLLEWKRVLLTAESFLNNFIKISREK